MCDFERDNCGWFETASADGFDWVRSSSSALAPDFQKQAPLWDHTYNKSEGKTMLEIENWHRYTYSLIVFKVETVNFFQTLRNYFFVQPEELFSVFF